MESPFSDKEFFMKYNKFAQTYFKTNPNIYSFLKIAPSNALSKKMGIVFLIMKLKSWPINLERKLLISTGQEIKYQLIIIHHFLKTFSKRQILE